ncbi:MAG TPA: hypothetical protein VKS79_16070 [Gemmataceae bacterium]|nr:hypothetical protein [Gemmataceae bacterium]
MMRVFGALFTEHREFVRDEMHRFDELLRMLAEQRRDPVPSENQCAPNDQPVEQAAPNDLPVNQIAPDLSQPLPRLSADLADQQIHIWLQQRLTELGEERAAQWKKMAGILGPDGPGHRQPQLDEF